MDPEVELVWVLAMALALAIMLIGLPFFTAGTFGGWLFVAGLAGLIALTVLGTRPPRRPS